VEFLSTSRPPAGVYISAVVLVKARSSCCPFIDRNARFRRDVNGICVHEAVQFFVRSPRNLGRIVGHVSPRVVTNA